MGIKERLITTVSPVWMDVYILSVPDQRGLEMSLTEATNLQ